MNGPQTLHKDPDRSSGLGVVETTLLAVPRFIKVESMTLGDVSTGLVYCFLRSVKYALPTQDRPSLDLVMDVPASSGCTDWGRQA
jgi:hypothetical protein